MKGLIHNTPSSALEVAKIVLPAELERMNAYMWENPPKKDPGVDARQADKTSRRHSSIRVAMV